ncbi:MAG: MFS transporter [Hyphomonadaceae bacterium]|nr:MFS transporter [Hyphomonadaceae bacterium]
METASASANAAAPGEAATEEVTPLNRVVAGAAAGTVIEYYDFGIYAVLAVALGHAFFPPDDPSLGVLLAVASTGVAFVVRPLGGMLFGMMSDRIGRKFTFMTTLFVMSGATILMGLTPNYATIGVAAPIIIVGLRVLQGLAVGGEYAAASTYVIEHSPDHKRGYYTGWLGGMTGGSLVLALLAVVATQRSLPPEAFQAWGWRFPFLYAAGLLLIALYIRTRLRESPVFRRLAASGRLAKTPLRDVLADPKALGRIMAVAFGVCTPQITSGLIGSMLALYYMQTSGGVEPSHATLLLAVGCLAAMPMTILAGALSDKLGRKPVQITGMALGAIGFIPLFHYLPAAAASSSALAYVLIILLQVPSSLVVGPAFATITESFPAAQRTTSAAIAFSTGGVIGGFSPAVALWLAKTYGDINWGLAYAIAVLTAGMVINLLWVRESSRIQLSADAS